VLPLFHELDAAELQRLAAGSRLTRLARADMVFRVGEPCNEFHVVITGQIKLFALSPAGQEKVIEILSPGQSFAEALMFMDKPYIVSAQALADSLVLTVGKAAVIDEILREPRFALRMLAGLSRRLHGLVRDVESYSLHTGMERVIGYLLRGQPPGRSEGGPAPSGGSERSERGGTYHPQAADDADDESDDGQVVSYSVTLPVSKATVASRLSLTPEYFSRVLHELQGAGLIEVDKRDIRIVDVKRLAAYRGG
jgi:CRP/FNR family transcriptional regulator, dissimilatory nitrate respiration regulator